MRSFVDRELDYIREIAYETIEKAPEGVTDFMECVNFWIDTVQPMIEDFHKGMTLSDIRWGATLYKELNWAGHSAMFGA